MNIDIVIGNPPYQELDGGGTGDSAEPLYDKFILKAKQITGQYIIFIVPSRWMVGGKSLDSFRREMIQSNHISHIIDFIDANTIFKNVWIDSGICYFLYNKRYSGKTDYTYIGYKGEISKSLRYLSNPLIDKVIRDYNQYNIIEHIINEYTFDSIVSSRNPYGINTDLFNKPENYKHTKLSSNPFENSIKIHGVKGNKGNTQRVFGYIHRDSISNNLNFVDKYNILFSYAYSLSQTTPPKPILAKPKEICTETFLNIGPFDTKEEQLNCYKYIQTKFFRALLYFNRAQKNSTSKTFKFIPLQDFKGTSDINWNQSIEAIDNQLYKKYSFTEKEICYIENLVKRRANYETVT